MAPAHSAGLSLAILGSSAEGTHGAIASSGTLENADTAPEKRVTVVEPPTKLAPKKMSSGAQGWKAARVETATRPSKRTTNWSRRPSRPPEAPYRALPAGGSIDPAETTISWAFAKSTLIGADMSRGAPQWSRPKAM